MKLKRKIPTNGTCAASGCRKKATGHNDDIPLCSAHLDNEPGTAVVVSDEQKEAQAEQARIERMLDEIRTIEYNDEADLQFAARVLHELAAEQARIDNKRKTATAPMRDAIRTVDSWFKPIIAAYAEATTIVKTGILAGRDGIQEAALAALRAYEYAMEEGDEEAQESALAAYNARPPLEGIPGVSFPTRWKFEVTDPDAVPREFMLIDDKAIRAVVTKQKQDTQIPGIRVYPESSVARVSEGE